MIDQLFHQSTKSITLNRGEYLLQQGKIDANVYFVEEGSLQVFILNDGQEQIIRFGYQFNIIVALDSFLTQSPTIYNIQAIKKSKIKIIPKSTIDDFLLKAENKNWWIGVLENLVVQQLDREVDILTASPKERYERVLRRSPQLFQEIPNKYIANYLRMTPETLSRLKKS